MATNNEVIVIGGGAIGAACARELARSGRRVLLLERGADKGAAWRAAAGMLAPQIEAGEGDPLFSWAVAGRDRYPALAAELNESTGINIGFWQEGIARLATTEADIALLQSRVTWQSSLGYGAEWISPESVRARWPWFGASFGALWAPNEAALDPLRLVQALQEDARQAGARVVADEVVALTRAGDRVTGVRSAGAAYSAEHVVIAAGAWGSRLAGLPRRIPVEPVRGQMAAFPWPAGVPRGIVYGNHVYLVARQGEAVAGSTMEDAGYDPGVTREGIDSIIRGIAGLCPALAGKTPIRTWAGLRPMTPDGFPIVGREPLLEGLWYATGHGRNGILLAAITGQTLARLFDGHAPGPELIVMRPDRFGAG